MLTNFFQFDLKYADHLFIVEFITTIPSFFDVFLYHCRYFFPRELFTKISCVFCFTVFIFSNTFNTKF